MKHAVVFEPDDFRVFLESLREIVRDELKSYIVEKPMTTREAAAYLRITEKTLWERIRKGKMPADLVHRSAGSVYFFASELEAYLKRS